MAPSGLRGIDVSEHQRTIDWAKVKQEGCHYAIVKISEGEDFIDRTDLADEHAPDGQRIDHLHARCTAVRQHELTLGVYHYLRPKPGRTGAVEADFAVRIAHAAGWGKAGDLQLVVDLEETALGRIATHRYLSQFVRRALDLTGHKPLIYVSPGFWERLGNPGNFGCKLWVAHYDVERPMIPPPWRDYVLWQHTSRGATAGTAGRVDLDVAHTPLPLIAGDQPLPRAPPTHAPPPLETPRERLVARMRRARRTYLSTGSDSALRVFLISKARLGVWDDRYCLYYGVDTNVEPAVKAYLTRAFAAGLVATSTTGGEHARESLHFARGPHGGGRAADAGLRRELIGTPQGRSRMERFQTREFERRAINHPIELIGPINEKVVLRGGVSPLTEGERLEEQHDNHVHGGF